jgi:hypothetical protein
MQQQQHVFCKRKVFSCHPSQVDCAVHATVLSSSSCSCVVPGCRRPEDTHGHI